MFAKETNRSSEKDQHLLSTRIEILSSGEGTESKQVARSHLISEGLTLVGQSPSAHVHLGGQGVGGIHLAIKTGKHPNDPITIMDLGGPTPIKLSGKPFIETTISETGIFDLEIGSRRVRLIRKKLSSDNLLKTNWEPVTDQKDRTLTLRMRVYQNGRPVEVRNATDSLWINDQFEVVGSHRLIWKNGNKAMAQIPQAWVGSGGRIQIGKKGIAKLEDWVNAQELELNTVYRIFNGKLVIELMVSEGQYRIGTGPTDVFPKELRKPFFISGLVTTLIFFAWMLLVGKPEPKVEEPYSLYARIQNIPIEKLPEVPSEQQSAGGGSGAPNNEAAAPTQGSASSAPSQLAASLTGGLKSLMGGIISQSKVASNAVVSETGIGQATAVASAGAVQTGKLAAVGSGNSNVAGAAKLGALALGGSGKGFAGGTGTGLGTGIGAGVGSGVGNGIGGGGFRLVEEESIVDGGLDKSVIAAVIQNNLSQIKYCYERQLVAEPDLFGKVVVKWEINAKGMVEGALVKQTTLASAPVENCMLSKISGWKFPQPKNGSRVTVSYPFLFKSTR